MLDTFLDSFEDHRHDGDRPALLAANMDKEHIHYNDFKTQPFLRLDELVILYRHLAAQRLSCVSG